MSEQLGFDGFVVLHAVNVYAMKKGNTVFVTYNLTPVVSSCVGAHILQVCFVGIRRECK